MLPQVLEEIRANLPEYARDTKLNLSNVLSTEELSERQRWGTAFACAMATENRALIEAFAVASREFLSADELTAVRTAASLMAMNNVYYRFLHLVNDSSLSERPARLRMNGLRGHGVDEVDFELWCLALSSLNGCGMCIESHYQHLREKGLGVDSVLAAVRIAAVINALSAVWPEAK